MELEGREDILVVISQVCGDVTGGDKKSQWMQLTLFTNLPLF